MMLWFLFLGLLTFCFNKVQINAEKEHVHIRLKIPKMINKHTHFETKYIHVFHPVPVVPPPPPIPPHHMIKTPGFRLRNDPYGPTAYNEINTTSHRSQTPSYLPLIGEDLHKSNRKPKEMSSEEFSLEDYSKSNDFSDEVMPKPNYLKSYSDKSKFNRKSKLGDLYLTTEHPFVPQNHYNTAHVNMNGQLNRMPKVTNVDKNYNDKYKTVYWKSSAQGYNKKVPYSNLDRSESRLTQIAILPRRDKFKKLPFIIKVSE